MQLQFLGTGGSLPIPMPTCACDLCDEAREKGAPYARRGNSMYLPELRAVVDAPESIHHSLNEHGVDGFDYLFLTHWHPDHVNGLRVLQSRDFTEHRRGERSFVEFYRSTAPTVVTTEPVYEQVCTVFGQLEYVIEEMGYADLHLLDEDPLTVGDYTVSAIPYSLSDDGTADATGFLIRDGDETVVIASDDARHLDLSELPDDIDLAVVECGMFEEGPDGEPLLTADGKQHLADELSHREVRARVERLAPTRAYLTEIGHQYARSYDDYAALEADYDRTRFAYDGLTVDTAAFDE